MQSLTFLIPVFNEAQGLADCVARVGSAAQDTVKDHPLHWSICLIDDGSTDSSWQLIEQLCAQNARITALKLSRNFGKEAALTAGLDHVDSDLVMILDADLQDPPELLGDFLRKQQEGFAVVYGVRRSRAGESWLKRATAAAFYRLLGRFSDSPIPRDTGDFRLLTRAAVEQLRRLRERNRFMKGLFAWVGLPQAAVHYDRQARITGSSAWSYWRLWNFALDGITSFSTLPLRLATYLGLLTAVFAFGFGGYILLRTLVFGVDLPGYASLMVTVMFLSGVQLMALGVIGEYLGRLMHEVKQRPIYLLETQINASQNASEPAQA
jgi:polyisoprenyl-phosphate glycosyltransferase